MTLSIGTQEWTLHLEMIEQASVEEGDWALFETQIWWPPDYERREEVQFRVPTQRLPAFAEQLRGFVRLERGRRLKQLQRDVAADEGME